MQNIDTRNKIKVLQEEVQILETKNQECAAASLDSTLDVLRARIDELFDSYIQEQRTRNK